MAFLLDHLPPQRPPGDRHPRRPGAAAGAAARARRARRDPRRRPALHRRTRPRRTSTDVMGLDLTAARRRGAGGTHRGLDRRAPAGGALDAGTRRRRRLHRRLRRGRPLHRRLPGRGGPAAPARAGPRASCSQTSILSRLSGPLCDAVTGQDGGKATLEALDRGNLFLVPLDDRRRWYRYHHLFADVLRAHLLDEQPDARPGACTGGRATGTSRTASASEAIRHALAGRRLARAADLVELRSRRMRASPAGGHAAAAGSRRSRTSVIRLAARAQRRATRGALLRSGEIDGVEARLRDAERWLDATGEARGPAGRRWSSSTRRNSARLPAAIAMYRAAPGPGCAATWPARWPTPDGRSTSSPRTTISGAGRRRGAAGPRLLGERGPGGARTGHTPSAWRACEQAGHIVGHARVLDRPGRHPDRAGPPPRRA